MFPDFKELLQSFRAHNVKYLIVGGYAVSLYAQPRATKDPDIFIKADATNAQAVYAALAGFGVSLANVSANDLADGEKFLRFGREPIAVDILPAIDGVDFDEVWPRPFEGVIDAGTGLTALFISKDDLIASKLAAGRMRDPADVEEIRNATSIEETRKDSAPSDTDDGSSR